MDVLKHRDGFSVLDGRELVRRIQLDCDLELGRRELRETHLVIALGRERCRFQGLSFFEMDARGFQLRALQIHLIAHVVRVDVQRLCVLDDSFIPVLPALGVAAFFISVEARATGNQQ